MQFIRLISQILDAIISLGMHFCAVYLFLKGEIVNGSIVFACASIYQIPILLMKK